jgi:hypothetical protein
MQASDGLSPGETRDYPNKDLVGENVKRAAGEGLKAIHFMDMENFKRGIKTHVNK